MRGGSWRRKGCLCSGRAGLASDADALQFDDAIYARLEERVHMDSQDIAQWTKAIAKEEKAF